MDMRQGQLGLALLEASGKGVSMRTTLVLYFTNGILGTAVRDVPTGAECALHAASSVSTLIQL